VSNSDRLNASQVIDAMDAERRYRRELEQEVERLRRQNALLGQAMSKWEQRVGPENLPAIGAEATLAYDEALGRTR
jgi:hypothetical protein